VNKPQQVENDINFEDFLKNSIRIPSQFYPLSIFHPFLFFYFN